MPTLVAVTMPGGPAFVDAITRVWAAGDAIAPIDPRLPSPEARRVLDALRPGAVIESDGKRRSLDDGLPTEAGDAVVVATSGTSGRPKGVVHTMGSVEASAMATSRALGVDPTADRWLACLPLAHIGGLSVVLRSVVTGTPVEVHDGFDPTAVVDAARRGATLVSLVTRALNQIPPKAFRTVLIGGAAPPADRPSNVVATYGMTETGSGIIYDDTKTQRHLDGLEIRIGDTGDGVPEGEILVRGPMLFRGYRQGPSPFDRDGWFPTGDLGSLVDGRLRVAGRSDDVIVTGGEKVWPEQIERHIATRHDVAQVAVIGRPDPDWGQRVVAVVVPQATESPPTVAQLRDTVIERFPVWCAPKAIELRSELPTTAIGKVRRRML